MLTLNNILLAWNINLSIYFIYQFLSLIECITAQKLKLFIKDFFSKCHQNRSFLRIRSHLLKKSLMENLIFLCNVCRLFLRWSISLHNWSNNTWT